MVDIKRIEKDLYQSSNLTFRDDGPVNKGAKTRQFSVFNTSSRALLGYIRWFAHWRKYCFFPLNSLFDDICLDQVSQFIKDRTKEHKSKLPNILRTKNMEKERRKRRIEQLTKKKNGATIVSVNESSGSEVPELVEGVEDLTPLEIELGTISF